MRALIVSGVAGLIGLGAVVGLAQLTPASGGESETPPAVAAGALPAGDGGQLSERLAALARAEAVVTRAEEVAGRAERGSSWAPAAGRAVIARWDDHDDDRDDHGYDDRDEDEDRDDDRGRDDD